MRGFSPVALLLVSLLSGCTDPAPAPAPGQDDSGRVTEGIAEEPAGAPWMQSGNVSLGWVVGTGADTWLGDGTVGVTSHEVCPNATFFVPNTTKAIELTWEAPTVQADRPGAGYYTLVISSPDHIYFIEPQVPVDQAYEMDPTPGVWELKVQARGAAANLLWTIHVEMSGEGLLEPTLEFYHDGDCIQ